MTIVEFFDRVPIENILSALICIRPTRVIMVGHDLDKMQRGIERFKKVLAARSIEVEMIPKLVYKNNLKNIVERLEVLIDRYDDCVFDLTGGEDLYLVALGVLLERYGSRVQCHRFNLNNNTLSDCDADGNVCMTGSFNVNVEENIIINGGKLVKDSTYSWIFSDAFVCDVERAFEVCRKDARAWNDRIGMLGSLCEMFRASGDGLMFSFDKARAETYLKRRGLDFAGLEVTLRELEKHGLVRELYADAKTLSFAFKDRQIRKMLTVSGQTLELFTAVKLRSLKDTDGTPLYHDVRVGAVIDWDSDEESRYRTLNEIDVLAMRGAVPVFISCKNGEFDAEELYKLNSVTEKFGSEYGRKAIVISAFREFRDPMKAKYLEERMNDMGIYPIKDVDIMTDSEIERKLRAIYRT